MHGTFGCLYCQLDTSEIFFLFSFTRTHLKFSVLFFLSYEPWYRPKCESMGIQDSIKLPVKLSCCLGKVLAPFYLETVDFYLPEEALLNYSETPVPE